MLTVYSDSHITRRKRYYLICDADDNVVWRSAYFNDVVGYLVDHEQDSCRLVTPDYQAQLNLIRVRATQETS